MRKPTDLCLLCRNKAATKTNSHILPKFISTGFLGAKGAPRKGFVLNGKNELSANPKKVQDSPKEDYILCDECEAYFGLLETSCAPALKFWKARIITGGAKLITIKPFLKIVQLAAPNPLIMRLLVYSMFWRTSISGLGPFQEYRLDPELEDSLRVNLINFKALTNADLVANLTSKEIALHPFSILTADEFRDETANVLAAINPGNPASLNVDKFGFYIYKSLEDVERNFMVDFCNITKAQLQIMVVSEQLWYDVMIKKPLAMAAEQAIKNKQKL